MYYINIVDTLKYINEINYCICGLIVNKKHFSEIVFAYMLFEQLSDIYVTC